MPRPFILRKREQSVLRKQDEPINTIRGQDASEEIELFSNVSSSASKNFVVGRVMSFFSSISNSAAKIFTANNNLSEIIESSTVSNILSIRKIFNNFVDNTKDLSFAAQKNISNINNIVYNTLKSIVSQPFTSNVGHSIGYIIFTLDSVNNRVNVVTIGGISVPSMGFDIPSFIGSPIGLGVDVNHIYIIDNSNNTLYVFNYNGVRQIDREVFSIPSNETYIGISAERVGYLYVLSDSHIYEYDYDGNMNNSFNLSIFNNNPLGISVASLLGTDFISVLQGNSNGFNDEIYFYTFTGNIGINPEIENTTNAISLSFFNEQFLFAKSDGSISFNSFGVMVLPLVSEISTNLSNLNNIQVIELEERFSTYNVNKIFSNTTNIVSNISSMGLNIFNFSIIHPTSVIFGSVRKILSNISSPISSTISGAIRDIILTNIVNINNITIRNNTKKYINNSINTITNIFNSILNDIIILSRIDIRGLLSNKDVVSNSIALNIINISIILNNNPIKNIKNILNISSVFNSITNQILFTMAIINAMSERGLSINVPINNNIVRVSVNNIFGGVKNIRSNISNIYNRAIGKGQNISSNVISNSETTLNNFIKIIQSITLPISRTTHDILNNIVILSSITPNSILNKAISYSLIGSTILISSIINTFIRFILMTGSTVNTIPSALRKRVNIITDIIVNPMGGIIYDIRHIISFISNISINSILNRNINFSIITSISNIIGSFIIGRFIIGSTVGVTSSSINRSVYINIFNIINNMSMTIYDTGQNIISMSNINISSNLVKGQLRRINNTIGINRNLIKSIIYNIIVSNVSIISRISIGRVIQLIGNINVTQLDGILKSTHTYYTNAVSINTIRSKNVLNNIFSNINNSNILNRGRIFTSSIGHSSGIIGKFINKSVLSSINSMGSLMDMTSNSMESIANVFINSVLFKSINKINSNNIINININNIFGAQKNIRDMPIIISSRLIKNIIIPNLFSNIIITSISGNIRRFIQLISSIVSPLEPTEDSFNIYTLNDRPNQVNVIDMDGNYIELSSFNFDDSIGSIEGIAVTEDRIHIISNADDMVYVFDDNGERQEGEEVWNLVSATYRGISADIDNRLLILSTNRLYVYDYDGNRQNDEEININPLLISATGVMAWRDRIYILDKESPSSGTDRVRVYDFNGNRLTEHDNILPNSVRNANGISHTDDNILIGQGTNIYVFDENWVEDVDGRMSVPVDNSRIRGMATRLLISPISRGPRLITNKVFNPILSPISGIINRGIGKRLQSIINISSEIRDTRILKLLQPIINITHHFSIRGLNVILSSDFAIISSSIRESHRPVHTISDVVGEISKETHRIRNIIRDIVSESVRETHRISHRINDLVSESVRETHRVSLAISDNVREEVRIVNSVIKRIYSNVDNIRNLTTPRKYTALIESIVNITGYLVDNINVPALLILNIRKAYNMVIKLISKG